MLLSSWLAAVRVSLRNTPRPRPGVRRRRRDPSWREWATERLEDRTLLTWPLVDVQAYVSVQEGTDFSAELTVQLSEAVPHPVSVEWEAHSNLSNDPKSGNPPLAPATKGLDYCSGTWFIDPCSGTIDFEPYHTWAKVSIPITDDQLVEFDEYFHVELTRAWGASLGDDLGRVKIEDDDGGGGGPPVPSPKLNIGDIVVDEDVGYAEISVWITGMPFSTVTVDYDTRDVTAVEPDDYAETSGTLTFEVGEFTKTIDVPIVDDELDEDDEFLEVVLSNGSIDIGKEVGAINITDDDDLPEISIGDATTDEPAMPFGTVAVPVTLSFAHDQTVTVDYATADGTALVAQPDYYQATGTVTFAPGITLQYIFVTIEDDTVPEPDETFEVNLSNPVEATIVDAQGIVTIEDDDAIHPFLSVSDVTVIEDAGTAEVTVTLSEPSGGGVSVDYATADVTAFSPNDYTWTSGNLQFNFGETEKTVFVTIIDDTIVEQSELFEFTLSNPVNAHIADGTGEVTIVDNDGLSVSIEPAVTVEEGQSASLDVTLSQTVSWPVVVMYATSNMSATSPADYQGTNSSVTIPANTLTATIPGIPTVLDTIDEPSEQFKVTITSNDALPDPNADEGIVTITNKPNNPPPNPPDVPDGPALIAPYHLDNDTGDGNDLITTDPTVTGKVTVDGQPMATDVEIDWDRDGQPDATTTSLASGWFTYNPSNNVPHGQVTIRARAANGDDVFGDWVSLTFLYIVGPEFDRDEYRVGVQEGVVSSEWSLELPVNNPTSESPNFSITAGNEDLGDTPNNPSWLFEVSSNGGNAELTYKRPLDFEHQYRYELTIQSNHSGHIDETLVVITVQDTPSPGSPVLDDLPAVISTGSVTVDWWATQHTDVYKLRYIDPDGVGGWIHDISGTSATIQGLTKEGHYLVQVQARGSFLEDGEWSAPVGFIYDTTPNPEVTELTAPFAGTSDLTPDFQWDAVTNATEYILQYEEADGSNPQTVYNISTNTWTPSVDLPEVPHRARIKARNATNESWSGSTNYMDDIDWSEWHYFAVGAETLAVTSEQPYSNNADSLAEGPLQQPRSGRMEGGFAIDDLTGSVSYDPSATLMNNAGLTATGFPVAQGTRTSAATGWLPVYNSHHGTHTTVSARVVLPENAITSLDVKTSIDGGLFGPTTTYTNLSGLTQTEVLVAASVDHSGLTTGLYDYTLEITANWSGGSDTVTVDGATAIVNRSQSEFGRGAWLPRLNELIIYDSMGPLGEGALLVRGNGTTAWYASSGSNYITPAGSFATLEAEAPPMVTYTLTFPDGEQQIFDASGQLMSLADSRGRFTNVVWAGGKIDAVTLPLTNQTLSYTYDIMSGDLTSINDFASRTWDFTVSNDLLTNVKAPADGNNGRPEVILDYTNNQLTKATDKTVAGDRFWEVTWDTSDFFESLERPDDTLWVQDSVYAVAIAAPTALASLAVSWEDRASNGTTVLRSGSRTLDGYGYTLTDTDTHGVTTVTTRNDDGQPTAMWQESGGQSTDPTEYTYAGWGALQRIDYPERIQKRWEFDSGSFRPHTVIDGNGIASRYTYHDGISGPEGAVHTVSVGRGSNWGLMVGTIYNLVTTLTYDTSTQEVSSEERDPATGPSITTTYTYDAYGWPATTYTPGVGTVTFDYDNLGLLEERTDELAAVWTYEYDDHGRQTKKTWPTLGGTAYFETSAFDTAGRLVEQTQRNTNITTWVYDSLDRIKQRTDPDPDGGGPLSAPVWLWNYADDHYTTTSPLQATTRYDYQSYDPRLIRKVTRHDGSYMEYWFDVFSRVDQQRNWWGGISVFTRDGKGRIDTEKRPDSLEHLIYVYDGEDRITQEYFAPPNTQIGDEDVTHGTITTRDDFGNTLIVEQVDGGAPRWEFLDHMAQPLRRQAAPTQDEAFPLGTDWYYDAWHRREYTYDVLGNQTWWVYNASKPRLVEKQYLPDPDGSGPLGRQVATWYYDVLGRTTQEIDFSGITTDYDYDSYLRLWKTTRPDPDDGGPLSAPQTIVTYDGLGRRSTSTYSAGSVSNVTSWSYDAMGNVLTQTDPDPDGGGPLAAPVTTYTYDPMGRLKTETNARSKTTTYTYQVDGDYTVTLHGQSQGTLHEHDLQGRLVKTTDPLSNVIEQEYNDLNQVTKRGDAGFSRYEQFTYGKAGQLQTHRYADGETRTIVYDDYLRPETVTDRGFVTVTTYDMAGRVATVGNAGNGLTGYEYDNLGRTLFVTDVYDQFNATEYDALGRVENTRDKRGFEVTTLYDDLNRPIGFEDEFRCRDQEWDDGGNLWKTSDPRDPSRTAIVYYTHDNLGRLIKEKDANGGETEYTYDPVGNRTSLKDPGQDSGTRNVTTFEYDDLDRLIKETNQAAKVREWDYDDAGNMISSTDRNGRVTEFDWEFAFDGGSNFRRDKERWKDAGNTIHTIDWDYDSDGRQWTVTELDDQSQEISKITYGYTTGGLIDSVTTERAGIETVLSYGFDTLDRQTTVTATVDTVTAYTNTWGYDDLDRVDEITQTNTAERKRVTLQYNGLSQIEQIDRYQGLTGNENLVASSEFVHDPQGRLTNLIHHDGNAAVSFFEWSYGIDHQIDQFTSQDGYDDYDYDLNDQLTDVDSTYADDQTFVYDDNGNRVSVTIDSNTDNYTHIDANRLTSDGTFSYEYDDEGNRTRKYDSSSEVLYGWDHRNRLVSVTFRDLPGETVTKTVTYEYDVNNRRVSKTVDDTLNTETEHYVWDNDHHTLTLDDSGDAQQINLYGDAVDLLFATETDSGDVFWSLADNQNTVRDVVQYDDVNDETDVVVHRKYDIWGNLISETNPQTGPVPENIPAGYTGREWDADAELYYYRARWYDPVVGRFVSEDPIGFEAGDANVQRYVGNQVPNAVDPSGLQISEVVGDRRFIAPSEPTSRPATRPRTQHPRQMIFQFEELTPVCGTVIAPAGSTLQFPSGALVLGTNHGVQDDVEAVEYVNPTIVSHDNISSLDEVREILKRHADNSIPALVFVGHGANGGCNIVPSHSTDPDPDDLSARDLLLPKNRDIRELLDKKLKKDARIFILGCRQATDQSTVHIQRLANLLKRRVVANPKNVRFGHKHIWCPGYVVPGFYKYKYKYYFYGLGPWLEFSPDRDAASNIRQQSAPSR